MTDNDPNPRIDLSNPDDWIYMNKYEDLRSLYFEQPMIIIGKVGKEMLYSCDTLQIQALQSISYRK